MAKPPIKKSAAWVAAAVLLLSAACALSQPAEVTPPVFRPDLSALAPDEFPDLIKRLEDMSQTHGEVSVRTRARYYLALALMHHNNPRPDYPRALVSLDEYIALDPADESLNEIVAWRSVLIALDTTLKEYTKLKESHSRLNAEYRRASKDRSDKDQMIRDLDQSLELQKKEIAALQEKIKQLDALHQEIEKKKKKKKSPVSRLPTTFF